MSRRQPGAPAPQLRLTHDDRDRVAEQLREAYSLGQLDEEEFDHRLDIALNAKVEADVEPLLQDLQIQRTPQATNAVAAQDDTGPQPGDRPWALAAHLSGYFTLPLGPLVVLLAKGGVSPFVRRHAMEALNYQLTFLLFSILLAPIAIVTLGLGALAYALFVVGWVFLPAIAGGAALIGARWKYPFSWRAVKDRDQ